MEVPFGGTSASAEENEFAIPEEYKDKAYLKDVTSMEDVYKKLDGAQSLIGQKVNFPTDESTEDELTKFYKAAGMPEKAEEYAFDKLEDEDRNVDRDKLLKDIYYKNGASAKAAKGITKDIEVLTKELEKAKIEQDDKEFDELGKEVFGDKAEKILASGKDLIEKNIPEKFKDAFSKLSNGNLMIMASVLDSVKSKYINEDKISEGDSTPGITKEGLQGKMQKLMNERGKLDAFNPGFDDLNTQISDIAKAIAKMGS